MEGVHFFFVKKEVMQKMADGGQLVEWVEGPGGSIIGTAAATLQQVPLHSCAANPWNPSLDPRCPVYFLLVFRLLLLPV